MAEDFMNHFRFNTEITPDRFTLVNLQKKPSKSFQIICMSEGIYFEKMMEMMGQKFLELVKMVDFLEKGIKFGNVQSMVALQATSKAIQSGLIGSEKKKKEEVSAVVPYYQPNPHHGNTSYSPNNHSPPPTYASDLYTLVEGRFLGYPSKYFDTTKRCVYHSNRIHLVYVGAANVNRNPLKSRSRQNPPQRDLKITVQVRPTVTVHTYQRQPVVATRGEESREYKIVPWTYQQKGKAKMTDAAAAHGKIQRRNITDLEAAEFGKKMSTKEYSVEDQLKKTPEQISIMDLLMSSDNHKDALLKVVSGASVPSNTTSEALAETIGKMAKANKITSEEMNFLSKAQVTTKLFISLSNMGTKWCLNCWSMEVQESTFESYVRVRASDGSQKDVIGEIYLALQIGPIKFPILFQVMDISYSNNLILRRPWIHMAGSEIVVHGEWGHSTYLEYVVPSIEGMDGVAFHIQDGYEGNNEIWIQARNRIGSQLREKEFVPEHVSCLGQSSVLEDDIIDEMGKLFVSKIKELCEGTDIKTPTIRDVEPGKELQNWTASPSLVRRESW
ncbi:hypothetical protein A4A49_51566 [Nicotiana attenuata]|uniref:Uncharacterized protein n=1 Tax=Nicotiana attenuata TaxID=49451 RepID=A0A1J6J596_NICAT|nr:hypothetical protein A4A49_51566 [Nicotiana attenuata]